MWNRRSFPLIFFGLFIAAIVGHSEVLFRLWLILAAGYLVSLVVRPRVRCLHCNGSGELRGRVWPWAFRRCPRCQGGRIIRRGASVAGLPHVRQQARQIRAARRDTRIWQRW